MGLTTQPLPFFGVLAVALCLAIAEVVSGQHAAGGASYLLIN